MSRFLNGIKSFVHSISTSDHYATYDPTRPQGQEDSAPLAAGGAEHRSSSSSANATGGAAGGTSAYTPGMRSQQMGSSGAGGIPLSDFNRDGPPIPSATLSWNRIDAWIEQNYPELYDQVLDGATPNDLNDLEHDLDCALPPDVRESFEVHDGQERGGKPTGVFYGITLLDLEGISEEWNVWRQTAVRLEEMQQRRKQQQSSKPSSSAAPPPPQSHGAVNSWIDHQGSCPPDYVQSVYAHPGWIPLAKDFDGNNIAVDLAPGPKGRYGQVILFGRDFDVKYAVAPSWGDFLAQFAADLESGSCYIDDDVENAVFAFKASDGRLVSYFNVLRKRVERTLPPKAAPRRSVMSASVFNAPVNSGRTTPRLVSPTGSSTSLHRTGNDSTIKLEPSAKGSSSRLAEGLNEIDLSENVDSSNKPSKDTKAATVGENDGDKDEVSPKESVSKDTAAEAIPKGDSKDAKDAKDAKDSKNSKNSEESKDIASESNPTGTEETSAKEEPVSATAEEAA